MIPILKTIRRAPHAMLVGLLAQLTIQTAAARTVELESKTPKIYVAHKRVTMTLADSLPPVVTGDSVCQFNLTPNKGGLRGACPPCSNGSAPRLTWWTAANGGSRVAEGSPFDPIAARLVNTANVGTTAFFAQCECGTVISPRVEARMTVLPTPSPKISGKTLVCPDETVTYSAPSVAGSTWTWTVPSGAQIVSRTQNQITIRWTLASNTTGHRLRVVETNAQGCQNADEIAISVRLTTLSCIGSINVGVPSGCQVTLLASTVLSTQTSIGSEAMRIQLLGGASGPVLEEGVGSMVIDGFSISGTSYEFIGRSLFYRVTDPCTGSTCSASVRFEDKTPPTMVCPRDTTLVCAQLAGANVPLPSVSGVPILSDCNRNPVYNYVDAVYEKDCTTPYTTFPTDIPLTRARPTILPFNDIVRIIVRSFTATDIMGNSSQPCQQLIYIRKATLDRVICPKDVELECQNVTTALNPSVTGFPVLDMDGNLNTTNDQFTLDKAVCRLEVRYNDDTLSSCRGSYRIIRNWRIFDWCATDNPNTPQNEIIKNCQQIISVVDKTHPSVTAQFTQYYGQNAQLVSRDTTFNFDGFSRQDGVSRTGTVQDIWALGSSTTCGGSVRIIIRARDLTCSKSRTNITVNDSRMVLLRGFPQYDAATGETIALYEGTFDGIGDYNVLFTVSDECGFAVARNNFMVRIRDNISPQPSCIEWTRVSLTSNGQGRMMATSLNAQSFDNCGVSYLEARRMGNCNNTADTLFKPFIDFSCCDAGDTVRVVLRVYDFAGNYNDCVVNVIVEDKSKPTCLAPPQRETRCNDVGSNLSAFGMASFFDNCAIRDTVYTENWNLNACKVGTITRKWVISDYGRLRDSCTQTIRVTGNSDFTVDFPDDVTVSCYDAVPTADQAREALMRNPSTADGHIVNNGCGTMMVEVSDNVFRGSADACVTIVRRYTVIDACKYNIAAPNNDPNCYGSPVCGDVHSNTNWAVQNSLNWQNLTRPACTNARERRFRDADALANDAQFGNAFADGIICYTQIIKVVDNTPPQYIAFTRDTTIRDVNGANCAGVVRLRVSAQDQCNVTTNNSTIRYGWTLFNLAENKVVKTATGSDFLEELPYGVPFEVRWTATDYCGNAAFFVTKVKVEDAKTPSLVCQNKTVALSRTGNGTGEAQVLSNEILMRASDNCTSESYLNGQITLERASTSTGSYPSVQINRVMFNCDDVGKNIPVRVWVRDSTGNAGFCTSLVTVQDNTNACTVLTMSTITGAITNDKNETVANVDVSVRANGNTLASATTTTSGSFRFDNLTAGQNVSITASRDDSPLNGVTTFDIATTSRHVLDISRISSPYRMIAADVNRDGDISAIDMLLMRRLVLRLIPKFPSSPAWRFVDKNYVFKNPADPFGEDFSETVSVSNLPLSTQANFVAIKVGDVNSSAIPSFTGEATTEVRNAPKKLTLQVEDIEVQAGLEYVIPFKVSQFDAQAFQFTLNKTEALEWVKIEKGDLADMSDANFGWFKHAITASWNGNPSAAHEILFKLAIKATKSGRLSDMLTLGSNLTPAEAYDAEGKPMSVQLRFSGGYTEGVTFTLYQNEPNPFDSQTRIAFNLPNESPAKLTIYDAAGRILFVSEGRFAKGYNEMVVARDDLKASGVLFYRLDTPTHSSVKKMVVIN